MTMKKKREKKKTCVLRQRDFAVETFFGLFCYCFGSKLNEKKNGKTSGVRKTNFYSQDGFFHWIVSKLNKKKSGKVTCVVRQRNFTVNETYFSLRYSKLTKKKKKRENLCCAATGGFTVETFFALRLCFETE